jgi:hypothetical protein
VDPNQTTQTLPSNAQPDTPINNTSGAYNRSWFELHIVCNEGKNVQLRNSVGNDNCNVSFNFVHMCLHLLDALVVLLKDVGSLFYGAFIQTRSCCVASLTRQALHSRALKNHA